MEILISIALIVAFLVISSYAVGYRRGVDDGFNSGWKEAKTMFRLMTLHNEDYEWRKFLSNDNESER